MLYLFYNDIVLSTPLPPPSAIVIESSVVNVPVAVPVRVIRATFVVVSNSVVTQLILQLA